MKKMKKKTFFGNIKLAIEIFILLSTLFNIVFEQSIKYHFYDFRYCFILLFSISAAISIIIIIKKKEITIINILSIIISLILVLMFSIYNPYPERSTIEISGVYIEKNGKYLPDLTETFSSEIKEDLEKIFINYAKQNNPFFQYMYPDCISYKYPQMYIANLDKKTIVERAQKNSRLLISLVCFSDDKGIKDIYYDINLKYLTIADHEKSEETQWLHNLFKKIINEKIITTEKISIIANIIFLDFNSRNITYQGRTNPAFYWSEYSSRIMNELYNLRNKYKFLYNEFDYMATGIIMSYYDVYHDELSDEEISDMLIDALSIYPYYPISNEKLFETEYIRINYYMWGINKKGSHENQLILSLLEYYIRKLTIDKKKEYVVKAYDMIFKNTKSIMLKLYYYDFSKAYKFIPNCDINDKTEINKMNKELDNIYNSEYPIEIKDFVILKCCIIYSLMAMYYISVDDQKKANECGLKVRKILENNQQVKNMYYLIGSSNDETKSEYYTE